jgi:hypothetical protein
MEGDYYSSLVLHIDFMATFNSNQLIFPVASHRESNVRKYFLSYSLA